MANITINIPVTNIGDVLAAPFDRIKVYRSTTGAAGPFVEITTGATRPALEPNVKIYPFVDTTGDNAVFHSTSFFNSLSMIESSMSEPVPGATDPALSIISVEDMKTNYLFGLDLTDDDGNEMPDSVHEHYIRSAFSWMETKLDIKIVPTIIIDERHDYIREDFVEWIKLKTDHVPVQQIDRVELVLPGDQKVINFLPESIQLFPEAGQINVVPGTGQVAQIFLTQGGLWFPWIARFQRSVPLVFQIDYVAGFEVGKVPQILVDAIGKYAAFGPLNIAGDLLGGAGIASQSISLDGLSTSFNTTSSSTSAGYGARLIQYTKELKEVIPQLRRSFHPVGMVVA